MSSNLKILPLFSLLFYLISPSFSSIEILPSDHIAIQYVVQVERTSTNTLIGVGTLITYNHILTLNSTYTDLQIPQDVRFRFRSVTPGSGPQASPERTFHHATENLAIALMRTRVNEQLSFAPRDRSSLLLGRFCTVFGFEGRSLVAVAAFPSQCGNLFCAPSENNFNSIFFAGATVICDGSSIGGFVVSLNSSQIVMDDVEKYDEWIEEILSGSQMKIGSVGVLVVGLILSKIVL